MSCVKISYEEWRPTISSWNVGESLSVNASGKVGKNPPLGEGWKPLTWHKIVTLSLKCFLQSFYRFDLSSTQAWQSVFTRRQAEEASNSSQSKTLDRYNTLKAWLDLKASGNNQVDSLILKSHEMTALFKTEYAFQLRKFKSLLIEESSQNNNEELVLFFRSFTTQYDKLKNDLIDPVSIPKVGLHELSIRCNELKGLWRKNIHRLYYEEIIDKNRFAVEESITLDLNVLNELHWRIKSFAHRLAHYGFIGPRFATLMHLNKERTRWPEAGLQTPLGRNLVKGINQGLSDRLQFLIAIFEKHDAFLKREPHPRLEMLAINFLGCTQVTALEEQKKLEDMLQETGNT